LVSVGFPQYCAGRKGNGDKEECGGKRGGGRGAPNQSIEFLSTVRREGARGVGRGIIKGKKKGGGGRREATQTLLFFNLSMIERARAPGGTGKGEYEKGKKKGKKKKKEKHVNTNVCVSRR